MKPQDTVNRLVHEKFRIPRDCLEFVQQNTGPIIQGGFGVIRKAHMQGLAEGSPLVSLLVVESDNRMEVAVKMLKFSEEATTQKVEKVQCMSLAFFVLSSEAHTEVHPRGASLVNAESREHPAVPWLSP